jgi:hypothetical protein
MSSPTNRAIIGSLTLVPAVLLFHMSSAAAADFLEHQRELLSGRPPAVSAPLNTPPGARQASPAGDAQESARQLLSGVKPRTADQTQPGRSPAAGHRVYGDAQMLARHLLTGGRDARSAGS